MQVSKPSAQKPCETFKNKQKWAMGDVNQTMAKFWSDSQSLIRREKHLPKSSDLVRNRESDDGSAINSRKWATRRIFPAERRLSDGKKLSDN